MRMIINRRTVGAGAAIVVIAAATTGFLIHRNRNVDEVESASIVFVSGLRTSTKLEVVYLAGDKPGCGEPYGVKVSENPETITLTAQTITRDIPPEGRGCTLQGVETKRVVSLKSPLGDRKVLDAFLQAHGEPAIVEVKAP